ncbi:histidine phosphatase family protein [Pseudomonas putida]|uniref:histidine phosphatase family protein n=1 Tax=Pseudomonas putida TaxID=303 RepID=UPI003D35082D
MKNVRLIRHGESDANAGKPTWDHASPPLTATGLEQAHMVAQLITPRPWNLRSCAPKQPRWPQWLSIPQPSW